MTNVTDFNSKAIRFQALQPETVAKLVSATADVALVVDTGGVVRHVEFGGDPGLAAELDHLIGRFWLDTVTPESRSKASDLLQEAAANDDARPREINHPAATDNDSVPIRYTAIRMTGSNEIIVVGRDLRNLAALEQRLSMTQQALERDFARLRASETRYRLLFAVTGEAVIIADAATRRITEANPSANLIFGERTRLNGRAVQQLFDSQSQDSLLSLMAQAASSPTGATGRCKTAEGGRELQVSVTLFRQEGASFLLLRAVSDMSQAKQGARGDFAEDLTAIIEKIPDAFVMTRANGRIVTANPAFLDMTQLATDQQIEGQPLERWLGRHGIDFSTLRGLLADGGIARGFSTVLRGSYGDMTEVEVSAVATGAKGEHHAFLIRSRQAEADLETRLKDDLPRSVQQMTELVGSVPMKDLVRQTTDIIERLCIEAALQLTGDNRASAADLLGLSRQSLYAKLHRYGLTYGESEASDS